jgi:hypothetical protein
MLPDRLLSSQRNWSWNLSRQISSIDGSQTKEIAVAFRGKWGRTLESSFYKKNPK